MRAWPIISARTRIVSSLKVTPGQAVASRIAVLEIPVVVRHRAVGELSVRCRRPKRSRAGVADLACIPRVNKFRSWGGDVVGRVDHVRERTLRQLRDVAAKPVHASQSVKPPRGARKS